MPYAVTHVILTIVIADIYRDYIAKKKFPMIYVLIAGIAGLLPDADIAVGGIFNLIFGTSFNFHRMFTHSLLYALLFLFIGFTLLPLGNRKYRIFSLKISNQAIAMFFFALSFGWFMHVLLDCSFAADGYLNLIPSIPLSFCPSSFSSNVFAGLDAIILVLWLVHEQWRHDIKDYI